MEPDREQGYKLLFEKHPQPMFVVDLETFACLAVNEAAVVHYGYSRDEFARMNIKDIRPAEDAAAALDYARGVQPGFHDAGVWRHKKKDGTIIEVNLCWNDVVFGGRRARLVLADDVTERRRAEDEVRQATERLQTLIHASPLAIITLDADGLVTSWNEAAERLFGWTSLEVLGRPLPYVPEGEEAESDVLWESVMHGRFVKGIELRRRKKDGSKVDINLWATPLRDAAGRVIVTMGLIADITERKRMEEQLRQSQKIEIVGQLAGGVAHDFNNLLTGILGYSNLLLSRMDGHDPLRPDVEEIRKAGERAASLTRQLLAFGRRQVLQPVVLDLNQIVADLDRMLHRLIGEHIELTTQRGMELGLVRADPGQVQQVIMNLVVNARDAMPDGGRLTIETANTHSDRLGPIRHGCVQSGPYVMVAVTDTGIGMDAETQERMFEPFFTTKESGRGTGLGLSTVYGIVMQSGGCLEVRSELGRGSRFEVFFPAVEAQPLPGRDAVESPACAGAEVVLLVEDGDVVRSLARVILERNGYTVLEAVNGEDALALAQGHRGPIHLLLTDVVMPRMNGPDLVRRLSPLRPDMRILYMSGHAGDEMPIVGRASGSAFLQKPFTPAILASKVRDVLDSRANPPASS